MAIQASTSAQISAPVAGAAVKLCITPPDGAAYWRVLRREGADVTGPEDPDATVVAAQTSETVILDWQDITNGTAYNYAVFYSVAGSWSDPDNETVTPEAAYTCDEIEPVAMITARMKAGVAAEIASGRFQTPAGKVNVHSNPLMLEGKVTFPCIGVHLDSSEPEEFGIGDVLGPDTDNGDGTMTRWEGAVWRYRLSAVGISLNPDERLRLRAIIGHTLQQNHEIFELMGLQDLTFSQSDHEDMEGSNAPFFITTAAISCQVVHWTARTLPKVASFTINYSAG